MAVVGTSRHGDKDQFMPMPQWFPDELAHAGPEHLDVEYVEGYDDKAGTDPTEDVALLRELGLNETSTVVDLGAGTGTFALAVALFCRRVVAVDVSAAMLGRLRVKADRMGITNIDVVHAGFLSYEHEDAPADAVYSRNALHHLSDFWKAIALQRVAAILRPGGVLRLRDLVYSFAPTEADEIVETWLANVTNDATRGWTRAELETHLREEYSTFSWLLEPMLERAGFAILDVSPSESKVFAAYTCVKL